MEGIILIVLSLIISQFFGKKNKETQETPPPVRQNPTKQNKTEQKKPSIFKELEDWSKQVLEQTEQKVPPKAKQVAQKVEEEVRERFPERVQRAERVERVERTSGRGSSVIEQTSLTNDSANLRPGRLSAHQQQTKRIVVEDPVHQLIDSREELAQAIVLAEILAPPVSKRR